MDDIIIAGGGPAGAYLAYCLAKKGIYATIFDDSHPREKPCGGGLSHLALKRFPILHELTGGKSPDNKVKFISPGGRMSFVEGTGISWAVSRIHLDRFLLERAKKAGARLIEKRVTDVSLKKDIWSVKTDNKVFHANLLVGADGVNSVVRKRTMGPIPKENLGVCYGCFAKSDRVEDAVIKFLKGRHGYAWVFPREDHLSIGVGVEYSDSGIVKDEFKMFMSQHLSHVNVFSTWGNLIPFVKDPEFFSLPACGKNHILIGDAAGHVDPITGEGITYALWSAELAGVAISEGSVLKFDDLWRAEYGHNLISGSMMRNTFFNDFMLELSIKMASRSKTYGRLLYDVINNSQEYKTFMRRLIKILPKSLLEFVF